MSHASPAALEEAAGVDWGFLFTPSFDVPRPLFLLGRNVVFIFDRLSGLGVLEVFGSTTGAGFGDRGLMVVEELLRSPISGLSKAFNGLLGEACAGLGGSAGLGRAISG